MRITPYGASWRALLEGEPLELGKLLALRGQEVALGSFGQKEEV